ncbi:MAG: DegV family protein, partial [Syntrophales bacterium]|nr:DegV family protein [Syntrophales bacterium]
GELLKPETGAVIWLEYTDNREWVAELREDLGKKYPKAEVTIKPLSLTTGVHTGPGTWAMAFYTEE